MSGKCTVLIFSKYFEKRVIKGSMETEVLIELNGLLQKRDTACTVIQQITCCFEVCAVLEWMDKSLVASELKSFSLLIVI